MLFVFPSEPNMAGVWHMVEKNSMLIIANKNGVLVSIHQLVSIMRNATEPGVGGGSQL